MNYGVEGEGQDVVDAVVVVVVAAVVVDDVVSDVTNFRRSLLEM